MTEIADSRPAGLAPKLALLFVSGLLSLAIAETGLRFHYIYMFRSVGTEADLRVGTQADDTRRKTRLADIIRPSERLDMIYDIKSNLDVEFIGTRVVTNDAGHRGPTIAREKKKGTFRIVGIGDSVMWGWGVKDEERYLDVLRDLLDASHPDIEWEVLNLAVPGYNFAMAVSSLEHVALAYDPDLVIYGNTGNDHCLPNFIRKERGFFDFESYIVLYLEHMRAEDKSGFFMIESDWSICNQSDAPADYSYMVGFNGFKQQLGRLEEISERESLPVVFFSPRPVLTESRLLKIARSKSSFPVIRDPRTAHWLEAGNKFHGLKLDGDSHPNPIAHRLYAQSLYDGLVAAGFYGALEDFPRD